MCYKIECTWVLIIEGTCNNKAEIPISDLGRWSFFLFFEPTIVIAGLRTILLGHGRDFGLAGIAP